MVNEETHRMDDEVPTGEIYVPATFQFSRASGRVERILVGLFEEGGEIEARRVPEDSMPEFYVPAMFQTSTDPGRIERFLRTVFDEGDERQLPDFPEEFRDDFYLPAANPDGYSRMGNQSHAPLIPVSEAPSRTGPRSEGGN